MVLAQRQRYRSMEQNRNPRDKSTYLWTPYLPQGGKDIQQKTDNLFNEVVKMRFNENKNDNLFNEVVKMV